jgi:hypothetical protein
MTAYELRKHLAAEHGVRILGADWDTLLAVHDVEHRAAGVDHHHHWDVEGDG